MGASVHRSEWLKGARFGPHEIVRLIGHGATASVFEARHVALGKSVAIKLLHEHLASDEQVAGRFLREGSVAAKLTHPNAIGVLDVGLEQGVPYLVMELLRGIDLRGLLADASPLVVEHALAFLLPIASALQHAHEAGVLHRDLKPANIFLSRDVRDDVVPKLLDFGLSKVVSGDSESALTKTELVAGTVLYMAPEQTLGVRNSSPASDQYSLAAILYECVTGAPPFVPEGTVYDVIERVRTTSPRAPSDARPELPYALDAVILRAMARDPSSRYESVRAFGRALLPFADEATKRLVERDFVERADSGSALASRPSIARAKGRDSGTDLGATRAEIATASSSALRKIGPLPCPPGTSPFRIKGLFYKGFVTQVAGAIGLDAFCEALPDDGLRTFIRQPFLASGRYDIFPFVPFWQALARRLGLSLGLVRTSTCAQARYDAKHAYKLIFDSRRPEDLADRISRFNAQIYDFGSFTGRIPEPNHITIEFSSIPAYIEPFFGPMHIAYAMESLRISGASDVVIMSQLVDGAGTRNGFPLVTFRTEMRWR